MTEMIGHETGNLAVRLAVAVLALSFAMCVANGIVVTSDPLGHSNGTPLAGTTSTASSATSAATLDVRASKSAERDEWTLSTLPPGFIILFR